MSLRIRFQGGPRAGEVLDFGDEVESITIGRDPQKCRLIFPADQTAVGREHCALRRVLGRYLLVINADNPVLVDGRPAHAEQALAATADLQLGHKGPTLVVETLGNSALPRTLDHGAGQPGQGTLVERLGTSLRMNRRLTALLIVFLLATAGTAWWSLRSTRLQLGAQIAKASEAVEASVKAQEPSITAALTAARPSVYLVIRQNRKGEDQGIGTAWVAGDGVLATNAHVAKEFDNHEVEGVLLARSTSSPPKDFRITKIVTHPGYLAFDKIWTKYTPIQVFGLSTQILRNIPACDVALMYVDNAKDLDPPLKLEPDQGLRSLKPGDVVGYIGYPMENMALGGANLKFPSPQTHVAHLTNLTDFFLVQSLTGDGELVQHALPAHGGASGSPILNARGNVVALLSAINMMPTPEGRAPLGVNVNFGQRADLLMELLNGTAEKAQNLRTARWTSDIRQFASLKDEWPTLVNRWIGEWKTQLAVPQTAKETKIHMTTGILDQPDPTGLFFRAFDVPIPGPGRYLFVAVNLSANRVGLLMADAAGNPLTRINFDNFFVLQGLKLDRKDALQAMIATPAKDCPFVFQVYRIGD